MTPDVANKALLDRWKDPAVGWPSKSAMPYVLENEVATEPSASVGYVRVRITEDNAQQRTMGPIGQRRHTRMGTISIMLSCPFDVGSGSGLLLGHKAREVFESLTISGVRCRAGQVRVVGNDGRWWNVLAMIPFDYDERK